MKNNDGTSSMHLPIFFDGLTENCEELPHWSDPTLTNYYDYAKKYKSFKYFEE